MASRALSTSRGTIRLPAYIPVTTFGDKYPLDDLIRPYLPRLAQAMMVSFHYARDLTGDVPLPLLVDSSGFASLFEGSHVYRAGELGVLEIRRDETVETITPLDVLSLQERVADIAFTLDFPIPPNVDPQEAHRRLELTITNAHWTLANRRKTSMLLFACVQAWDSESARECARAYAHAGFDGVAIGGLVPRARDLDMVLAIVRAVREEIGELPLHVFGLGKPELVESLYAAGVDSVDSSSYVKLAADGRLWADPQYQAVQPSAIDRLHLALCNLAAATGKTMPLSASRLVFETHRLAALAPGQGNDRATVSA